MTAAMVSFVISDTALADANGAECSDFTLTTGTAPIEISLPKSMNPRLEGGVVYAEHKGSLDTGDPRKDTQNRPYVIKVSIDEAVSRTVEDLYWKQWSVLDIFRDVPEERVFEAATGTALDAGCVSFEQGLCPRQGRGYALFNLPEYAAINKAVLITSHVYQGDEFSAPTPFLKGAFGRDRLFALSSDTPVVVFEALRKSMTGSMSEFDRTVHSPYRLEFVSSLSAMLDKCRGNRP